jgi:3-methylfumaryl-CoA hydratase
MNDELNIEHLQSWVGREHRIDDTLEPFRAQALAAALDHPSVPQPGEALPPSWHWLYFLETPTSAMTGPDGHPRKGGWLPPIPLPRRMWSAGSVDVLQPLVLAAAASKRSVVRSVELKTGRSGSLIFVVLEHEVRQRNALCIREEQTLAYRPAPSAPAPLPPGEKAPEDCGWSRSLVPSSVLLFRFSALTYNGHRIHYDREYATREEFYPGLVVHGPLLATLLLDVALERAGERRVEHFEFRAIRPTFEGVEMKLCARSEGRETKLWSVTNEGFVGMHLSARFAGDPS